MTIQNHLFRALLGGTVVLAGLAVGCSTLSSTVSESSGRTIAYTPGLPNFDMEAISTLRGDRSGFDLYIGIPQASLVYLKRGDHYIARFEGVIQLLDADGESVLMERGIRDSVVARTYEETQSFEPLLFERRVLVEPGEYLVRCGIQDQTSQKTAARIQRLTVFGLETAEPGLSRIRVEGKSTGAPFEPIVSLHIPSNMDSLRALVEFYNAPEGKPIDVGLVLLRFRSDDEVAVMPYWISPMMGSLGYRGIDYRSPEVIQRSIRRLRDPGEEILLEFTLPALEQGVYRIEITVQTPEDEEGGEAILLRQERELSVKGEDFPLVSGIDQMVESLIYIAREKELNEIRDAPTLEEKRRRFDAFWGSLVSNRQVAENLLKQYYSRIEEANLLFTSHKEGWKTDRGMVYILLGAPVYVEVQFDTEVWYYSYSDRDPMNTFVFRRVRTLKGQETFQNYILARRPEYERTWTRAVSRWRDGSIL